MAKPTAFVTPPYPILFTALRGGRARVPHGDAELMLALLVDGTPSFLACHRIPEEGLDGLVTSLQGGDPRVTVVGMWVDGAGGRRGRLERRAAAFISLVCSDGRRITVARVLGEEPDSSPEMLARHVIRQIARGVQVPDLVGR
jgi:hypothetical protein